MHESGKKKSTEGSSGGAGTNRRRIGSIVHDERGNASVEWRDAPPGEERPVLEVLGGTGFTLKNDDLSYDPYSHRTASSPTRSAGSTTRTDLRKLSEWIKLRRELEERKLRGDVDDDDKQD